MCHTEQIRFRLCGDLAPETKIRYYPRANRDAANRLAPCVNVIISKGWRPIDYDCCCSTTCCNRIKNDAEAKYQQAKAAYDAMKRNSGPEIRTRLQQAIITRTQVNSQHANCANVRPTAVLR